MKSTTTWKNNYHSVVDNGRGHAVNLDLPESQNGENSGATALEVCVMSFSGCIATIFAMLANKMKLQFSQLEVEVDAQKSKETGTIGNVVTEVRIKSDENPEKLQKCLDLTEKTCPVGVLFRNAGVELESKMVLL